MLTFLVRRVAQIVPTLIFVSMLIFGLQQLLPGDPARGAGGRGSRSFRRRLPAREAPSRRAAAGALRVLDQGRAAGRPGRVDAPRQKPVLDLILQKLPVTLELAFLAIVIALAIGIPAGIISAVKRNTAWDHAANADRAVGTVHAEFLARHHADPALLGDAGLAARLRIRQPVRGLARQPGVADHARVRAGQRDRRGADAPHAQRDAAGALVRLRAHGARQGPARMARRPAACAAQCADPGDHAGRAGIGHAAVRRGAHRAGVHDSRLRQAHRRRRIQPRLLRSCRASCCSRRPRTSC